jgi:hypothetical protein
MAPPVPRSPFRLRAVRLGALSLAALCAAALGGCGDTLQVQPIPHNILEGLIVSPHPVYWLGASFRGLAVTDAVHDPSGSFTVQYGNCLEGGQSSCVPPLRVVTSPDNSFLPGTPAAGTRTSLRGVEGVISDGGRTISLPAGGVVLDIYANTAPLAKAAARTAVPINAVGVPEGPLPAPQPDTGFGETPLPTQVPSPVRALP